MVNTATEKIVLLVDDDPVILEYLSNALNETDSTYDVITANDGRAALDIMEHQDIAMVVTDLDMPEITGLELLSEIRKKYDTTQVIIMTGYGTPQVKSKAMDQGCLHFIEKPFESTYLKSLIGKEINKKDKGFVGTLKQIHLIDLIQMCCQAGMSMVIRVINDEDKGTVVIEQGNIIHAVCGNLVGEDAFFRILSWKSGEFETIGSIHVPEPTIKQNSQYLLMEAARIVDEDEKQGHVEDDAKMKAPEKRKVLIVDDSKMMCRVLTDLFEKDAGLEVIGIAANGQEALEKIQAMKPDLITLDVNMPVMGGETALKHIMIQSPCPVVIISSVGGDAPGKILDFLKLGAVDFIPKPGKAGSESFAEERLIKRAKQAAHGRLDRFRRVKLKDVKNDRRLDLSENEPGESLVVLCSGAGGYMELMEFFSRIPEDVEFPVLWVQDMPWSLCRPLAEFIDNHSRIPVRAVSDRTLLSKGNGYVASLEGAVWLDHATMTLMTEPQLPKEGRSTQIDDFLTHLADHLTSALQVLLLSGADCGCLTGLKAVKDRKGNVLTQNPETCVAPGLLETAIEKKLADATADTQDMIRRMMSWKSH